MWNAEMAGENLIACDEDKEAVVDLISFVVTLER